MASLANFEKVKEGGLGVGIGITDDNTIGSANPKMKPKQFKNDDDLRGFNLLGQPVMMPKQFRIVNGRLGLQLSKTTYVLVVDQSCRVTHNVERTDPG